MLIMKKEKILEVLTNKITELENLITKKHDEIITAYQMKRTKFENLVAEYRELHTGRCELATVLKNYDYCPIEALNEVIEKLGH